MTNPDDETMEPLEPDQEPTEEEKRNHALARVLHQTALVFGYNELAKQVKLLGEKLYFRLAMQTAKEHLEELGGHIEITEDVVVARLPGGPAFIKFYASDIELMREAVKKWDLEHNPDTHPAVAASLEQRPKRCLGQPHVETAEYEITTNGATVWVNGATGLLGRFGIHGIDIHRKLEEQSEKGQCLFCTHETTTGHDWMTFVAKMKEFHGIEVPVLEFTPIRLRGAHGIHV
jgi:hypothetical protein